MMKVESAMTRDPLTITSGTLLDDAMNLMDEHEICHLPVVEDGRVLGIVSDRDLLEATGWLPQRVRTLVRTSIRDETRRTVAEVMHSDAVVARPEEDVVDAAADLLVQGVGCLPVVDGERLVGILAASDALRVYLDACAKGRLGPQHDPPAGECMTMIVRTVTPDTTLGEARNICAGQDIRHLPVLEQNRLVGIVSDRDLRMAVGRGRRDDYQVRGIMSEDVVTAAVATPLTRCAERMLEHAIATLPVLAADELVGILSSSDIVRHAMNALRGLPDEG